MRQLKESAHMLLLDDFLSWTSIEINTTQKPIFRKEKAENHRNSNDKIKKHQTYNWNIDFMNPQILV